MKNPIAKSGLAQVFGRTAPSAAQLMMMGYQQEMERRAKEAENKQKMIKDNRDFLLKEATVDYDAKRKDIGTYAAQQVQRYQSYVADLLKANEMGDLSSAQMADAMKVKSQILSDVKQANALVDEIGSAIELVQQNEDIYDPAIFGALGDLYNKIVGQGEDGSFYMNDVSPTAVQDLIGGVNFLNKPAVINKELEEHARRVDSIDQLGGGSSITSMKTVTPWTDIDENGNVVVTNVAGYLASLGKDSISKKIIEDDAKKLAGSDDPAVWRKRMNEAATLRLMNSGVTKVEKRAQLKAPYQGTYGDRVDERMTASMNDMLKEFEISRRTGEFTEKGKYYAQSILTRRFNPEDIEFIEKGQTYDENGELKVAKDQMIKVRTGGEKLFGYINQGEFVYIPTSNLGGLQDYAVDFLNRTKGSITLPPSLQNSEGEDTFDEL